MKNRIALILATFFALAGVSFGQGTLMVNTSTGAITAPVSAATFRSGNSLQSTITFGTGVQTALGVNIGSAGAPVLFNGAGGTPSSMTGTNITGIPESGVTNLTTDLAAKAPLASPTLTGVPLAPTAAAATNTTQIATTAYAFAERTNAATLTNKTINDSTNSIGDANTYVHDLATVPNQSGGWSEYYVTGSDFTTSSTTAVDITGMVSGTLTNSAVYEFEVVCRIVNAADTAGVKVGYHGGGTGTAATVFSNNMFNSNSVTAVSTGGINAIDTLSPAFLVYSGGEGMWISRGHFIAMSTGTATMSVQIAKVTSGTLTVRKGSKLKIRKLQQ